jgi:hypothetical protein
MAAIYRAIVLKLRSVLLTMRNEWRRPALHIFYTLPCSMGGTAWFCEELEPVLML